MFNQTLLYRNESCLKKKHLTLKVLHKTLISNRIIHSQETNNSIASDIISVCFCFKGAGERVKLNPPSEVSAKWSLHVVKFCIHVPAQPFLFVSFLQKHKIFTLVDCSIHLDPSVKELLTKRGNFLVILPRDKTGDLQVNNRDLHHPMKTSYHGKEAFLMIEKLRWDNQDVQGNFFWNT